MKGYSFSIRDNAKNIYLRGSVFVSGQRSSEKKMSMAIYDILSEYNNGNNNNNKYPEEGEVTAIRFLVR